MDSPISIHNVKHLIKKVEDWKQTIRDAGGNPEASLFLTTIDGLINLENNGITVQLTLEKDYSYDAILRNAAVLGEVKADGSRAKLGEAIPRVTRKPGAVIKETIRGRILQELQPSFKQDLEGILESDLAADLDKEIAQLLLDASSPDVCLSTLSSDVQAMTNRGRIEE